MAERETTILDYILILVKWKKFILLFTVLSALLAAGIVLILPEWYSASATILIPQDQGVSLGSDQGVSLGSSSSLISQVQSRIPSLPFMGNLFGGGSGSQQFLSILNSRVAQEYIARKFNLQEQYETENSEATIKILKNHVSFQETEQLGGIAISVEDVSPIQASQMANTYVYFLDSLNIRFQTERARGNRIFIHERYDKTFGELTDAEDSLRTFQLTHNIISFPEQLEAEIQSYAQLRGQLALKEIELESTGSFIGQDHPDIQLLQSQVSSIYNQLAQYEKQSNNITSGDKSAEFVMPFAETPQIGMEFFRLQREVKIKAIVYTMLAQQLEQAKIQEARETPTLLILDKAVPPVLRSKPQRTVTVLIVTFISFFLSFVFALTSEHLYRLQTADPREKEKLLTIRRLLSSAKTQDE